MPPEKGGTLTLACISSSPDTKKLDLLRYVKKKKPSIALSKKESFSIKEEKKRKGGHLRSQSTKKSTNPREAVMFNQARSGRLPFISFSEHLA